MTAALQFHLVEVPAGTADPTAYMVDRLIERTAGPGRGRAFPAAGAGSDRDHDPRSTRSSAARIAAGFEKLLAVTGMTREQLRRYMRDDLRITTYLNQRFGATTEPGSRDAAIKTWTAELRKRADVTVLYRVASER